MCRVQPTLNGTLIPFHILTLIITTFRLYHRWHRRQLWWDDHLAAAALLCDLAFASGIIFNSLNSSNRTVIIFLIVLPIYLLTLFARLSLGFAIQRMCATVVGRSWPFYAMNMLFVAIFFMSMIPGILSTAPECMPTTNLQGWMPNVNCRILEITADIAISTDIMSDALLIGVPLYTLWRVHLPNKKRRMIFTIFGAGAISSVPAVSYMIAAAIPVDPLCLSLIIHLKVPIIILVCNLLFLITHIYQQLIPSDDKDKEMVSLTTRNRPGCSVDGGIYTNIGSVPQSTMQHSNSSLMPTQTSYMLTSSSFPDTPSLVCSSSDGGGLEATVTAGTFLVKSTIN